MTSGATTRLQAIGLSRHDPGADRLLLDHIDLTISAGDRIALVGPSGSGKSTLLRAIAMLDPVDGGHVTFGGQTIQGDAVPAYRRKVVYLSQRPSLIAGTVLQNLAMAFSFASADQSFNSSEAVAMLQTLERDETMLRQDAATLSGGEQQLIALVRAVLVRPSVLLFDEPTASLDPKSTAVFEDLVNAWSGADASRSYLWTSHDAEQVRRMTSRVCTIGNGKISDE